MLIPSHTKTNEELTKMGCGRDTIDLIPVLKPTGISKACNDYIKQDKDPWKKEDKICSRELIDYYEHTNMKETICKQKSKMDICATPVLSKMCYGAWENTNQCDNSGFYHKSK